jgi:hypothetical protein
MVTKKERYNFGNRNVRTDYRRTYEASPFFEFSSPALTTGKSWIIDIGEEKPEAKKHLPFSNVRIVNNSDENIAFYPNQTSEAINVPAGTIISFDKMSIPALNSAKLVNLSATSSLANEVKVSFWREGVEIDGAFQRMHKAFYERFLFPQNRNVI